MKHNKEAEQRVRDYYEAARESFVAKMKTEDDERSNLKFKIASFVIHEIIHSAPTWFKNHFLSNIAIHDHHLESSNKNILKVERAFYDAIADYLIKLESDVEYVRRILDPMTEEQEKKDFWKPIVFDAFLIVGIYYTPSIGSGSNAHRKSQRKHIGSSQAMHQGDSEMGGSML